GVAADGPGIIGNRRIGRRQGGVAQKQRRRKALDRALDHPLGVAGLDLALDQHRELGERTGRREGVRDSAERILMAVEPAFLRQVDAPIDHILAVMVARGQPEHLNDAGRRALVTVDRLVGDPDAHAASKDRFGDYIKYCWAMVAPSRLLSATNPLMNSCRPLWKISSIRLFPSRA